MAMAIAIGKHRDSYRGFVSKGRSHADYREHFVKISVQFY